MIGGIYTELPDLRLEDWALVEIRARTATPRGDLALGFNYTETDPDHPDWPFASAGRWSPLVPDGTVQTYRLSLDHVGIQGLFEQATKLGITTLDDPEQYDLSLALGGGAVRLLELTAAYAAFANGGFRVDPVSILEVSDLQGNVLYTAPSASIKRVLDERVAWLISDILSDNDARRLGFGPHSTLRIDRPAAVKTGTTSNFHDNIDRFVLKFHFFQFVNTQH